ncbi:DUF3488 and transglutaminase-like domain-containing protein [Bacteriovoracaceae bacterium]|nr:DUF3488 and transglutaminase-like domain-containing protein [Bacteriovoracaceae bacterium]
MAFSLILEVDSLFIIISIPLSFLFLFKHFLKPIVLNIFLITLVFFLLVRFNLSLSPELVINFFFIVYTFKFLQLRTTRDFHICLQTLILITVASSLFNKTMTHQFFVLISLVSLVSLTSVKTLVPGKEAIPTNFKNIFKVLLIASPLIVTLFLLFPRFRYFFPSLVKPKKNEIGYSREINLKHIGQLQTSNKLALRVSGPEIPQELRYWRGTELSITDGLNWRYNIFPQEFNILEPNASTNELSFTYFPIDQSIKDFIFLDYPIFNLIEEDVLRIVKSRRRNSLESYTQLSSILSKKQFKLKQEKINKHYLQTPKDLSQRVKRLSQKVFSKESTAAENINRFKEYIQKEKFFYTLAPGKMNSLDDILNKKVGFCSHYSSLMAILMRLAGIPSRIVTGFQGGIYNDYGKYYIIRSNDAHVWVEAYMEKKWYRIDPTFFIGPNRIITGGQTFYQTQPFQNKVNQLFGLDLKKSSLYQVFIEAQKVFDNLNYQAQLFFDNFNLSTQKKWAKKLGLSLKKFMLYSFSFVIILSLLLYAGLRLWSLLTNYSSADWWDQKYYYIKLDISRKYQVNLNGLTPNKILQLIKNDENKSTQLYKVFLHHYISIKYGRGHSSYSRKSINYFWRWVKFKEAFSR